MSLSQASMGETVLVVRVKSTDLKLRRHLENLGIVTGAEITPLACSDGNVIVRVYDSRIALNNEVAQDISVCMRPVCA